MHSKYEGPISDRIDLLILQPTPFCNLDCDYCYLQHRSSAKKMTLAVVERSVEAVIASGLAKDTLTVVWHAGEPLAVPVSYYEEAFPRMDARAHGVRIVHALQTNGTLINHRWCELFRKYDVNVGVSVDGPAFLHDLHRKDRHGSGTHARVMQGIECLKQYSIPFHAIAVLSGDALPYPDEVFAFFQELGATTIGFNIEELEGCHNSSTLRGIAGDQGIANFFQRLYQLQKVSGSTLRIREFDRSFQAIALPEETSPQGVTGRNHQVVPFGIVSIDWAGNMSTFSPELLDASCGEAGGFQFGNILENELLEMLDNARFLQVAEGIQEGVRMCAADCEYFQFCLGGAPSNKYFENGSFASTETMYCRHTIQLPLEIALADLEAELNLPPSTPRNAQQRNAPVGHLPESRERLIQIQTT